MSAQGTLAPRVRWLAVLPVMASLVAVLAVVADEPLKNPYTGDAKAIEEGHQLFLDTGLLRLPRPPRRRRNGSESYRCRKSMDLQANRRDVVPHDQ